MAYLRKHNQTLEKEKTQLHTFKNQVDEEIERLLRNQSSYCYLTMDDINQFQMELPEQDLVVVNAPYETDIEVHHNNNKNKSNYPYPTANNRKRNKSSEKVILRTHIII